MIINLIYRPLLVYYKIIEINKKDKYYIKIYKTIIENKNKF